MGREIHTLGRKQRKAEKETSLEEASEMAILLLNTEGEKKDLEDMAQALLFAGALGATDFLNLGKGHISPGTPFA